MAETTEKEMKVVFERPHSLLPVVTNFCPGCPHGIVERLVCEVMDELDIEGETIGVAPVGCSVISYDFFGCDMIEAAHGRAPAVATGIKRTHPKVHGKTFPIIDKDKMSVTEYSARLQALVTFTIPADKIDLPPATWEAGDEVRMYYKENAKHQALRFMNITRTNIFKK